MSPILFLTFNRPDETAVVFEAIRKYRPERLYFAADGAREGRPEEAENCRRVREISTKVDWPCEVKTLFRDRNLGCKNAVSSAITWFFENEEEGIILEDDCLPNEDFFRFCDTLLPYYRTNESVMHIGGNNFQDGTTRGDGSYYFSVIPHIWGWATWRRAWKHYDIQMQHEDIVDKNITLPFLEKKYWFMMFNRVRKGLINTWDYQWTFTVWKQKGICVSPQKNLVTNIGFGTSGTHTHAEDDSLSKLETATLGPIQHPPKVVVNKAADSYWFKKVIPWQMKVKSLLGS